MDISSLPPTLTIEECASVLRLSRGSAYEAARTGQIPTIRIGRRWLVPRAKLLQMLGEDAHDAGLGRPEATYIGEAEGS